VRKVFDAGRYVRWGSGGSGLALEISSFVGPCEGEVWSRRGRREGAELEGENKGWRGAGLQGLLSVIEMGGGALAVL